MKRIVLIPLLLISISTPVFPQREPDNLKTGLQFNSLFTSNEFPTDVHYKFPWIIRGIARFGLADYLNGEVGAGYGRYNGLGFSEDYYETSMYPVDFRLLIKLIKKDTYPYIMLGAGVSYYEVKDFPESSASPKEIKDKGFTGIAPAGLGYQFSFSRYVHADISVGVTISTTDNLNYYKDGDAPDVYYFAGIGLLFGENPLRDDDGDGLNNDREDELGTDPDNPDTDGDQLTDGSEVMRHFTDPLLKDTDSDGLSDGEEFSKYKTDPLKVDTDGDSLTDGTEITIYRTDPLNRDTDKDSLSDGDELFKYKTDPLREDSDSDMLSDYKELFDYRTDPLREDTDSGSVMDGEEVKRGTDPLDPDDDVMKVGKPVVFKGINFDFNSAEITPESIPILEKAYQTLVNNPDVIVEIAGHTDEIGTDDYNIKLSLQRAEAVKSWLAGRGIAASRLKAAGYGKQKPAAPNDTPENRAKNRRIEFIRLK